MGGRRQGIKGSLSVAKNDRRRQTADRRRQTAKLRSIFIPGGRRQPVNSALKTFVLTSGEC